MVETDEHSWACLPPESRGNAEDLQEGGGASTPSSTLQIFGACGMHALVPSPWAWAGPGDLQSQSKGTSFLCLD